MSSATPLFDAVSRYEQDDPCSRKHRGAPTSEAAHEAAKSVKRKQHAEILSALAVAGAYGRTCYELSQRLGMAYTSASARLSELKRSGEVVESGERRPTPSGCSAAVVVLPRFL